MKISSRNEKLDSITGILILWMMFYHVFQWANLTDSSFYKTPLEWLFFFMPWFYFKSGMFFRPARYYSFVDLIKKANKLLVPLGIWFAVGYIITIPVQLIEGNQSLLKIIISPLYHFVRFGDTIGNGPLWFLLSLFLTQVIACYFFKIRLFIVLLLFLPFLGGVLQYYSIVLPMGGSTIPLGLFFYFSGFLYSKCNIYFNARILLLIIPVFVVVNILFFSYVDIHRNSLKYGSYVGFVVLSLLAIIVVIYLSKFISFKPLIWVGQRSMYFFVLHWPVFYVMKNAYIYMGNTAAGYNFVCFLIISAFPLCWVLTKIIESKKY